MPATETHSACSILRQELQLFLTGDREKCKGAKISPLECLLSLMRAEEETDGGREEEAEEDMTEEEEGRGGGK